MHSWEWCPLSHFSLLNINGKTLAILFPVISLRIDPLRFRDLHPRLLHCIRRNVVLVIPLLNQLRSICPKFTPCGDIINAGAPSGSLSPLSVCHVHQNFPYVFARFSSSGFPTISGIRGFTQSPDLICTIQQYLR